MDRKEEIRIIIKHLIDDVERLAKKDVSFLGNRIVENGELITRYKNELAEIEQL